MAMKVLGKKSRILIAVLLAATLAMSIAAYNVTSNLKNYRTLLQNEAAGELRKDYQESARDSLQLVLNISSFPGLTQLLNLVDLNFSSIKSELLSAVDIAPLVLGSPQRLRYLVSFQNSAEARGSGGILGAYAIVEFFQGQIKLVQSGSNASLYSMSLKKIPIVVPDEFLQLYGHNPAILQNSNLSPHFPYGAEIWLGLWEKKFGEKLDGVIAADPEALSYVLKATGPITLDSGEEISSENVVEETLKNAYKKFEFDNNGRKEYLVKILNATAKELEAGNYSKIKIAQALRDSIIQNRLLIYSTDATVEKILSTSRFGGFMRTEPNNEFRTVIQNIDASKLDYYLHREVSVKSTTCGVNRETQVRIRVTHTLDTGKGLSAYVLTRADKGKPVDLITGAHRFKLFIYGPVGAQLVSASRENRTENLGGSSTERLRPIYVVDVDLSPGESEEFLANFAGGTGKISFVDQPLVRTTEIDISDGC
jgi:hypothetical protein